MKKEALIENIDNLLAKYEKLEKDIVDYEETSTDDAEHIIVAFGISSRVALTAIRTLRAQGIKIGLFRPKTLFPFPKKSLHELSKNLKSIMSVELNEGQMADDIELAVQCAAPVKRFGWYGGVVPSVTELVDRVKKSI